MVRWPDQRAITRELSARVGPIFAGLGLRAFDDVELAVSFDFGEVAAQVIDRSRCVALYADIHSHYWSARERLNLSLASTDEEIATTLRASFARLLARQAALPPVGEPPPATARSSRRRPPKGPAPRMALIHQRRPRAPRRP